MMEFINNYWPFLLAGFFAAAFIWRSEKARIEAEEGHG